MLPPTLVGCSAKNYFSVAQAREWGPAVAAGVADDPAGTGGLFICPSFPLIPLLLDGFATAGGLVGAQDVSAHPPGAFTGEVSATVLADLGARFVMVGHPERRRYFSDTDEVIKAKVAATVAAGMAPILVVGESVRGDSPEDVVAQQLDHWLGSNSGDLVVAYEPAWAIGQPEPAPADHIAQSTAAIRTLAASRTGDTRILYAAVLSPGPSRASWRPPPIPPEFRTVFSWPASGWTRRTSSPASERSASTGSNRLYRVG